MTRRKSSPSIAEESAVRVRIVDGELVADNDPDMLAKWEKRDKNAEETKLAKNNDVSATDAESTARKIGSLIGFYGSELAALEHVVSTWKEPEWTPNDYDPRATPRARGEKSGAVRRARSRVDLDRMQRLEQDYRALGHSDREVNSYLAGRFSVTSQYIGRLRKNQKPS